MSPRRAVIQKSSQAEDTALARIEKYALEASEMIKTKQLNGVWTFEDLHKEYETPSFVYRVRNCVVRHIQVVGDSFLLTNGENDNIDVFDINQPVALKALNIQGRQMNCSIVTSDKVFIGCRDRRVFIYDKFNFDLLKTLETPESVHCMSIINNGSNVAIGMSDGHVIIVTNDSDLPGNLKGSQIKNAAHLKEVGGIWSICGVNNDTQMALGTISGVYLVNIGPKTITTTNVRYFEGKNIWNVQESRVNVLLCTHWDSAHLYQIDLTQTDTK